MTDNPAHPAFASLYNPTMWIAEQVLFRPHRIYLARGLSGRVLDLGAGTGTMFPYITAQADNKQLPTLYAIEPDPYMRRQAQSRANSLALDIEIQAAEAESLPYPADFFDTVIAALVFCTIPDVETAISEIIRVLKPGGELRVLEHVIDTGWRRQIQETLAPIWQAVAGNCHLTRRTGTRLVQTRELESIELKHMKIGVLPVRPFIRGRLRYRRA